MNPILRNTLQQRLEFADKLTGKISNLTLDREKLKGMRDDRDVTFKIYANTGGPVTLTAGVMMSDTFRSEEIQCLLNTMIDLVTKKINQAKEAYTKL